VAYSIQSVVEPVYNQNSSNIIYLYMMQKLLQLCLLAIFFSASVANSEDLFRWVDAEGTVHYGDQVPPQHVKQEHSKLDARGRVLETRARALTPEERAREGELNKLRLEQKRLLEKQKARDRVLINTFRSEDDIVLARDGKLATYDAQIEITYTNIDRLKRRLINQQARAAEWERQGRKANKKLSTGIENTLQDIQSNYASILRRETAKNATARKYNTDLVRFRELMHLKDVSLSEIEADTPKSSRFTLVETAQSCDSDSQCNEYWIRAVKYGKDHSSTLVQVNSENIFMTATPDAKEELGVTVSRIRVNKDSPEVIFMDIQCSHTIGGEDFCKTRKVNEIRNGFRSALKEKS
jgi:hypothetical protein